MKKAVFAGFFATTMLAAAAFAAAPTWDYVGAIDMQPHPTVSRVTSADADAVGGVYFVDNGSDKIFYIADAASLAINGTTVDATNVAPVEITHSFGSASSWQGIAVDAATGNVYASGRTSTGPATIIVKIVPDNPAAPTSWTAADVTGITGGPYSGVEVVGANNIVLPDYATGAIQFFSISGSAATAVGSSIAGGGGFASKLTYSASNNKIYEVVSTDNFTGQINSFTYNGTPGTATYDGVFAAAVSSDNTAVASAYYRNANVDATNHVLVQGIRRGTTGTPAAGFLFYDLDTANTTPYYTEDGTVTGAAFSASSASRQPMGVVFFTKGGVDYVGLGGQLDTNGKLYVFSKHVSAVSHWEMYD